MEEAKDRVNPYVGLSRFRSCDLFAKVRKLAVNIDEEYAHRHQSPLWAVREYHAGRAIIEDRLNSGCREVVVMCSADYLGLARHPLVVAAAIRATESLGTSVNSVPMMAGSTVLHRNLEDSLARFAGMEAAVLFQTGYAANMGVISALCSYRDVIVVDNLVHHSVLDGARLSGAKRFKFRHSDPSHLEGILTETRAKHSDAGILVVVEGVYGIDGDIAPLPDLIRVSHKFGAKVMVDDAHATGVIGSTGHGSVEHFNGTIKPDLIMGSLSKALGSAGGWVACSRKVADFLRYYARTIVLSVGLPAACVGAGLASLGLIEQERSLLERLHANIAFFKEGLLRLKHANAAFSASAIISIPVGNYSALSEVNADLFRRGVWAEGLPFPLVAKGEERIRFRLTASHSAEDLKFALDAVEAAFSKCSINSVDHKTHE